jgi:hypothetical protein
LQRFILAEYNDALKRAQRLNIAREHLLQTNSCAQAITSIQNDDMEIYMRWLVCHFYAQKSFVHSMKQLEWLPYQVSVEFLALSSNANTSSSSTNLMSVTANSTSMLNMQQQQQQQAGANSFNNVTSSNFKFNKPSSDSNTNKNNPYSIYNMMMGKFKMLDNVYLATTNATVPREEVFNSLSFRNLKL